MGKKYGWLVLFVYALVAGLSQMLWLNFATILNEVQKQYSVSESTASLLLIVFPFTFVLLSIPAGSMIDKRGYKFTVGFGAFLMAIFSLLRSCTGNFWLLFAGQLGISLGQPFVVNGITKLTMDWFPKEQTILATGLGTVGMFAGMAISMAATPILFNSIGLHGTMLVFAVISICLFFTFVLICKTNPETKANNAPEFNSRFWPQLRRTNLILLNFLAFLGLGYFNGLTSWIESILATNSITSIQAGVVGAILILGGIFGSIVIPALSAKLQMRKIFLIVSSLVAAIALIPLCKSGNYTDLLFWSFINGFFFLPAYALLLDITSLEVGESFAGTATGVLMMAGNIGAVIVIAIMGWMKGDSVTFPSAFTFLMLLLSVLVVSALFVHESKGKTALI